MKSDAFSFLISPIYSCCSYSRNMRPVNGTFLFLETRSRSHQVASWRLIPRLAIPLSKAPFFISSSFWTLRRISVGWTLAKCQRDCFQDKKVHDVEPMIFPWRPCRCVHRDVTMTHLQVCYTCLTYRHVSRTSAPRSCSLPCAPEFQAYLSVDWVILSYGVDRHKYLRNSTRF